MTGVAGLSRRSFFRLVGGGIVVLVGVGQRGSHSQPGRRLYPEDFNAYLVIREDGRVTVFSGKIEMGQGVLTSQAQMVAEELGVELAAIDMVLGDTDRCPWDRGTFGSLTTRVFGPALRAAAARARSVVLTLAAARLGVPVEQLRVQQGVVSVAAQPSRSVAFGELSKDVRIAQTVDLEAVLRSVADFNIMGTSPKQLDGLDKVTGAAKYAADIRLAGMLHAQILRPPMHGASLAQLDLSGAQALPGVTVVNQGNLVAVLHADPEVAQAALARVQATWRRPEARLDRDNIFEHLWQRAGALKRVSDRGDLEAARAGAARVFERDYHKGYVAHAPIEPHAAVAQVAHGKLTVWASTQTPFPTRDLIAQTLALDPTKVRVITPYVGGGFGGKSASGQAVEAARLAQITGKPVQVAWSRAEEFFNDTFDPASVVKITSSIDGQGRILLWDYVVVGAGERGASLLYDIANARVRAAGRATYDPAAAGAGLHPFAVGAWRSPGANMNVFAIESQIDIMASAAGVDPLAFRLGHLADARMRRVLQAAANAFDWKPAAAPSRCGVGVACSSDAGTYVATMAEVKVEPRSGQVTVVRLVCAQDMGIVVNPDGARMQIEGGLMMGLGYTLTEELRFKGGDILDQNFDRYCIPRFSWTPRIESVLVSNDALAPQGGGEPSITTTGAVIANAVFDATGARLLRLPMTPERVRQALATA